MLSICRFDRVCVQLTVASLHVCFMNKCLFFDEKPMLTTDRRVVRSLNTCRTNIIPFKTFTFDTLSKIVRCFLANFMKGTHNYSQEGEDVHAKRSKTYKSVSIQE